MKPSETLRNTNQDLIELYVNMETNLMLNIAKKLQLGKITEDNAYDWQVERLNQLNGLQEENIRYIASQSGLIEKEIENILEKSINQTLKKDNVLFKTAVSKGALKQIDESLLVKNALFIAKRDTLSTFNKVNSSLVKNSGEEYVKIINKVSTEVIAGTKDVFSAVRESTRQLAENGITAFTASNGAEWSTEAYTTMVIRTNSSNTANAVQDERISQAGGNYVEINSYTGARPLCSGDQGQIFSLNGDITPIKDLNGSMIYPRAWSSSTNGQPAGILGINCGHSKFLFLPDLSAFEREKIPQKENTKEYKEKQQQRYLERQIRNAKRERDILINSNADKELIKEAKVKVSSGQSTMRDFIKKTDQTRRPAREFVGG